ncbi:GGDEF domain-containing protein [Bradyrhizobium viridifuturi]|jgi:diguanylate cyclase (GGDEF)-like protein|uniref:GGDEF domain-containing protein n=2 Tax=Nitrobacteraceae TaxID=41294 RepID=UPI0003FCE6F2|nr:GGDEF domain-containing protein [Bradyrhizobium viridifuturi]MCA3568670.1 GGDEF domain-containing protein [Bradyrhizobium sp.]OYU58695.1 MAG: GGDEF domain-containing protein [Bradyrhizobium sp. PARBB1]PSO22565.1 GGDEF domain-containing protein [Bradyrhizobium sp. MOS004]QRI68757.1 GGDEF domain-containing protein [Bradyrhizobium sp. PSBB068]MBR1020726.1 GGDEF domain-containing protein [Bradyrhizobium viridifuturi]
MRMKKKTTAAASGAAKRRKSAPAARNPGPGRTGTKATGTKAAGTEASTRGAVASSDKSTIRRLRTQLARAQARIEELQTSAETDFLLDIFNRRGFERELARSLSFIKRYQASGALIVLDVDRLKPINDAFGHAAGDEVLKTIVAAISDQIRASDVIGRLGGDEFAVLLWNLSETDARAKAAALEDAIDRLSFVFRGSRVSAGASAGVAIITAHSDVDRVLDEADRAMYVRKAQRRHES